ASWTECGWDARSASFAFVDPGARTIQDIHMRLDRKTRLAPRIAAQRGWAVARVGQLLAIRSGSTARRRVARFDATFDSEFPDRALDVRRWLKHPSGRPLLGSGLFQSMPTRS